MLTAVMDQATCLISADAIGTSDPSPHCIAWTLAPVRDENFKIHVAQPSSVLTAVVIDCDLGHCGRMTHWDSLNLDRLPIRDYTIFIRYKRGPVFVTIQSSFVTREAPYS